MPEYCSVSSTLVKRQKQSGTQNVGVATRKTIEPGTGFQAVPGATVFGTLCPTQNETKSTGAHMRHLFQLGTT